MNEASINLTFLIMKKNIVFVFAIVIFLLSCKKDASIEKIGTSTFDPVIESNIPYSQIHKRSTGFAGRIGSTELLVFDNMNVVRATLAELEHQCDVLDSLFLLEYGHLDEDSLFKVQTELSFSEWKPLVDFNDYFLFSSLYQKIAQDELVWLQNDTLDETKDPDNHFVLEYSIRAILNLDNEVQIGDSVYVLVDSGYYCFPASDLKMHTAINAGKVIHSEIVRFVGDNSWDRVSCRSNVRKEDKVENSNKTRRLKCVLSHWTHPWDRRVAAKSDNYKKNWYGGWSHYKTAIGARVYGHVSGGDGSCSVQFNFNPGMYGAYSSNAKHIEHKIYVSTKTASGWVKGNFSGAEGLSKSLVLTW